MASIPLNRSLHRPVKTCTECKQAKLRCDSRAKYPAPCTRCAARHLQCSVDASFRRTPARKRVEDMARELEVLKNQTIEESGATISPSIAEIPFRTPDSALASSGAAVLDECDILADSFQLGSFIVDKNTVIDCFQLFSSFFYPQFPIINPAISIPSIYSSSPFLFWTIVAIVLSKHINPAHVALSTQLTKPYMAELEATILKAPLPLQTIQALAYLIMWPFTTEKQPQDPSWLYCGIAVNAAVGMGLHHYRSMNSTRNTSMSSGPSTWLGCFFASTTLSMFIGISPSINGPSDLEAIEQFVRRNPIQPEFSYQIMTQHTLAKFTSILQENSKEAINCSLVKVVETELDGLKSRFLTEWTAKTEVTLLVAKLHLYTMVVVRMQPDLASREVLLKLGLSVSLRIVYLNDQGLAYGSTNYPDMPTAELQRTLPKNHFRGLALATVFLLRYFALNNQASPEERELARNHVAIAHTYFKAASTAPQDDRDRVARLFETLSRQQPFDIDNAKLRIDNRMGWSLMDDTIEIGKEIREKSEQSTRVEMPIIERTSVNDQTLDFDSSMMSGFDPLDFSLPEDIWGDSLWGAFDIGIGPSMH